MLEDISEKLGAACSRWAIGTLVLTALVTSEFAGVGTLPALPLAALTVTLAAFCEPELESQTDTTPKRARNCNNLIDFLIIWLNVLAQLAAGATCARVASATVDYMSEGRSRVWLFGYESHSLGEPWPDVLGVTIIVVVTAMFMLGLERSPYFFIILYSSVIGSFGFFVTIGSLRADTTFWRHESFLPLGWKGIISTSAMCSFGFVDSFPKTTRYKNIKLISFIFLPLACYVAIAGVFSLLTDFRELTGTAIPLVRVFEVRDVDWARPVMAACTICVVCVALTEICPILHNLLVRLASREWRLLSRSLAYENSSTGSAVLAVFTAGSLMSILAFACPLSYLVRLLNVSPLLRHVLQAVQVLNLRYQSDQSFDDLPVRTDVSYSRLNQATNPAPKPNVKKDGNPSTISGGMNTKFLWFLPKSLRQKHNLVTAATVSTKNISEERECLLMGEYSPELPDVPKPLESNLDEDYDSEGNNMTTASQKSSTDDEDSGSSTDVDAAVQEYKERIKVATLSGAYSNQMKVPSGSTHKCVIILVFIMLMLNCFLALGFIMDVPVLIWTSLGAIGFCTLAVAVQPQKPIEPSPLPAGNTGSSSFVDSSLSSAGAILVPYIPSMSMTLNALTFSSILPDIWPGILLWIFAGLILFCRCDCCDDTSTRKHRIRLRAPPRGSVVSTLVPSHRALSKENAKRLTHVDTILIAR